MTTLLLAEHDNKTLKDATHKAFDRGEGVLAPDVHVLVAGKGLPLGRRSRRQARWRQQGPARRWRRLRAHAGRTGERAGPIARARI